MVYVMFVGTACNMLMHKCFCQNYRKLPPVIIISWDKGEIVDSVFCFEATAARNFAGL